MRGGGSWACTDHVWRLLAGWCMGVSREMKKDCASCTNESISSHFSTSLSPRLGSRPRRCMRGDLGTLSISLTRLSYLLAGIPGTEQRGVQMRLACYQ